MEINISELENPKVISVSDIGENITIVGMENHKKYTFRIKTIDNLGNASLGKIIETIPHDTTPPAEVSNVSITAADSTLSLTWENPIDDDFDKVIVTLSTSDDNVLVRTIEKGKNETQSIVFDNLTNYVDYEITLKTVDKEGNISNGTNVIGHSVDLTPPSEVTNFRAVAGHESVTLSWTNPDDSDFSHVEIMYGNKTKRSTGTSEIITNLNNYENYTFTIKAVDNKGNKSTGIYITTQPIDLIPPSNVTNLTCQLNGTSVTLTWTDPVDDDFSHIKLTYGNNNVNIESGIQTYTIDNLQEKQTYLFTIKSVDIHENESNGVSSSVTIPDYTAPENVSNLTATPDDTNNTITLEWTAPSDNDIDHYEIDYTLKNDNNIIDSLTTSQNSITISGLVIGTEYTFTVYAIDDSNNASSGVTIDSLIPQSAEPEE